MIDNVEKINIMNIYSWSISMPETHDQKKTFEVRVKLYQHGHRGKNAICTVGNWEKYPCQGRCDIRKPVKSLSIHEVTSNL